MNKEIEELTEQRLKLAREIGAGRMLSYLSDKNLISPQDALATLIKVDEIAAEGQKTN